MYIRTRLYVRGCDALEEHATRVARNLMARYTFMAGEFTIDVNAKGGPSAPLEFLLPQDRCLQFAARHFHGGGDREGSFIASDLP